MRRYAWLHCSDGLGKAHLHPVGTDTQGRACTFTDTDTGRHNTICGVTGPSGERPVTWGPGTLDPCRRCFARWVAAAWPLEAPTTTRFRP